MPEPEKIVRILLEKAGINVNGREPWDMQIHDGRTYERFIRDKSVGFGETYMEGWWDSDQLDEMFAKLSRAQIEKELRMNTKLLLYLLKHKVFKPPTTKTSLTGNQLHYDIGNELFESMLDPEYNYSCGNWKNLGNVEIAWKIPRNLIRAQEAKLEQICKKLYLKRGDSVLDIGCGWGNFAKYATTHYGVTVVGITLSKQQAFIAKRRCKGLPIKILAQDYYNLSNEQFDKVVSIESLEEESHRNYVPFMQTAAAHLKKNGLFLLQTIGTNRSAVSGDPWVDKYVFPNAHIPSLTQICRAVEDIFVIEDIHNYGVYYYPTLMSWFRNFNKKWKHLAETNFEKYNERFYRMWKFYLLSSAGSFKARALQAWQIVFSKRKTLESYNSIR